MIGKDNSYRLVHGVAILARDGKPFGHCWIERGNQVLDYSNGKNLTKDGAKEIYKKDYWDKNKVDDLPEDLKHIFFDMCVNQGRGTAVKIIQRACNAKGADLAIDGGFGPGTKGAVDTYKPSLDRVRCYRLKHYYDLVNRKPEQERFLFGWFKRALSV